MARYHNQRKQWNGRETYVKRSVRFNSGAVQGSSVKQNNKKKGRRHTGSKLSDKKINTMVETRMVEIAKKEVEKNLKFLTSRKYLFCSYNNNTNVYTVLAPRSDLIDWDGNVVELSNIPKVDVETIPNVPQANDPMTMVNEAADGDGGNQLMIGDTIHGYRWGDTIYIKSLSANLRLRSVQLEADGSDLDLYGTIKINYAFVLWRDEETTMDLVLTEPEAIELLNTPKPFGYSGKLDRSIEMKFNGLNTRTLCSGSCLLNVNDNMTTERFTSIYKKFDKPIQITYDDNDQNGQRCNQKIYFVIRSTVPSAGAYAGIKPSVYVATKINYYEQ